MPRSIDPREGKSRLWWTRTVLAMLVSCPLVTFAFDTHLDADGTLHITITDPTGENIFIKIIDEDGQKYVKINDKWPFDPNGHSVHPEDIKKIIIEGGPGPDLIDLSGVTKENFTQLAGSDHDYETTDIEVYGNDGNDIVEGSELNETITGGDDDDTIRGNAGNDFLQGNLGSDDVRGGAGDDYVSGGYDNDIVHGDDGNDDVYGGYGHDTCYGDAGNDRLNGMDGSDILDGGDGNDDLDGGDNDDKIIGGSGDDVIRGGWGDDVCDGGTGDDRVYQRFGSADVLTDSTGVDTLSFAIDSLGLKLDFDLLNVWQVANIEGDSAMIGTLFEHIVGSVGDDVFRIGPGAIPRSIDGWTQEIADTLYFDARGLDVIDDGTSLTVAGYEPVTYANFEAVICENTTSVAADGASTPPYRFGLSQNTPNPFNPQTTLRFTVERRCRVELRIYDIMGREKAVLVDRSYEPGEYRVSWNATNLAAGLYIGRIRMGDFQASVKMLLLE